MCRSQRHNAFYHVATPESAKSQCLLCKASLDNCKALLYINVMIKSFRSKALKVFWNKGNSRYLDPSHVEKIQLILNALDKAEQPEDMDLIGFFLHAMSGDRAGQYSVTVRANWRITLYFDGPDAVRVDYEDYHEGHH